VQANATCTDTSGSFTCACNTGYEGDGVNCTDSDETGDDGGDPAPGTTTGETGAPSTTAGETGAPGTTTGETAAEPTTTTSTPQPMTTTSTTPEPDSDECARETHNCDVPPPPKRHLSVT
jgi:hypothetical protein